MRIILAKLKASKVPKGHNPDAMVVSGYRFDKKQNWTMTKAKEWTAKQKEEGNLSLESFSDTANRVGDALKKLYEYKDEDESHLLFLVDIGPETAIFELDGFYWSIPYTVNDNGEVLFGEPVATERAWKGGGLVPAESNTGFVEKLKLVGQSLWAGFRFTDDETRERVEQGTVKDVSIYAAPDVHDPRTGQKWPWVLMHVLLTNYPQVQGLALFGSEEPVAADAFAGAKIIHLEEVKDMGDDKQDAVTLTAEEAQQFEALRALRLSADQVAEWQAMGLSFERVKALVVDEEATRTKARGLEVQAILLALEGQGEHDGVTQVEGTRHWPVVCTEVEKALKEQVAPLALDVGSDGKTGLDEVVLSIVNAIPAEGRMSLTAQPGGDKEPVGENRPPTDEQIDDLDNRLR